VTTVLPLERFKQQAQKGLGNKHNTEKNEKRSATNAMHLETSITLEKLELT
jgi:hypothetical protein